MEAESCRLIFTPELVDRGWEYRDARSLEARFLWSHIRCVCSQSQCLSSLASFAEDVERGMRRDFESRDRDQVLRCSQDSSPAIPNEPAHVVSDSIPIVSALPPDHWSEVESFSIDRGANLRGIGGPGSDNCFRSINRTGLAILPLGFNIPTSQTDLIGFTKAPRPEMVRSRSPSTLVDGIKWTSEGTGDPAFDTGRGEGAESGDGAYDGICSYPDLEGTGWLSQQELCNLHKWVAKIRVGESMTGDKVLADTAARSRPCAYLPGCDGVKKRKRFVELADNMPEEVTLLANACAANTIPNQKISSSVDPGDADGSSSVTASKSSPCLEMNSNVRVDDDDDLITKLAPLIKRQIEDALNSTLLPLVSVLRSREEDEQRHRENMLALEEQKLALKREKLLFKRRRVVQPPSTKKRSGLRVKV